MEHDQASEREVLQHKRTLLRQDLRELELQVARFGSLYAPVDILKQIRETQEQIVYLDAQTKQLGGYKEPSIQSNPMNARASLQYKRELLTTQLRGLETQAARFGRRSLPLTLVQKLRQMRDELDRVEAELAALDAL